MKNFNTTSNLIALFSFLLGTLIYLIYQLTKNQFFIAVGIIYVLIAIFFNTLVLVYNINKLLFKKEKMKTLTEILMLLANIPIAYTYLLAVVND